MQDARPSHTALRVAHRRAQHQSLDRPLVFADALAQRVADHASPPGYRPSESENPLLSRGLRAFMAARSRYAEDQLAEAIARGIRQYVILGAGLDTFAYRSPHPQPLRIFEVDYPATQAWKRGSLERAGIAPPASLCFVPVDFETQSLAEQLGLAGFDAGAPAFFSWLGVVPYLSDEALNATLGFIAGLPRGTAVVFDYPLPPAALEPAHRLAMEELARRVGALGEPFRSYFRPEALAAKLRGLGFGEVRDLAGAEINARYFSGREDGLQVGSAAHLALALV
jgi:methyltransferase (TIGR00027 family)